MALPPSAFTLRLTHKSIGSVIVVVEGYFFVDENREPLRDMGGPSLDKTNFLPEWITVL